MANKAFEIQESKLRIGGLDLEAGVTAIAIPGLSQAATYFVEEVDERDGNNPSTFGSNASDVTVIDNSRYLALSGTTPSSSYIAAEYSVDELDDGEIDEINVETAGVFLSADKTKAETGNMWATTVANPFVSFNAGDWTQIPYRPKVRAGEVENIGGGGGGASNLADLDDVALEEPSNGQVLMWNNSQEKWQNQSLSGVGSTGDITFDGVNIIGTGAGDYPGLIQLTPNDNSTYTEAGQFLEIYPTRGQDAPHIHIAAGNGGDLMLGNDMSYVDVNHTGSVKVQTYNGENTPTQWQFKTNGDLQLPAGGDIVNSSGTSVLGGGSGGGISFNEDGGLEFPDGSIQNTAYVTLPQLGYFTELVHTSDNNNLRGEAVVVDSSGNSYVSYTYYDQNDDRSYGGVMKFSSSGAKLWSKNILPQNTNARAVEIVSLEYITLGSDPMLVAFGNYYDGTAGKDVAIMYYINPVTGAVGQSMIDTEITSTGGIQLSDGVSGTDVDGPYAVVVGQASNEVLEKSFTPLAGSTTDKLYVSWSEFNASGVLPGENLTYTVNGYYGVKMNASDSTASPTGTGEGLYVSVAAVEGGTYNIIRTNGWSGVINGWTVPVTLRVLGSTLGGVDNVKYTAISEGISGNGSLFFEVALFPDLANVQNGWNVSGSGITGVVTVSNVQNAGGYWRFDVPVGVTVSPGETYTLDGNGNDFIFDFDRTVFDNNSNNIVAAVSNRRGTPVSNVYCPGWNGKDWGAEIGNTLTFNYELNSQAYIARFGMISWSKSIGATNYDRLISVVVDSSKNIYTVGKTNNGDRSAIVIKYDVQGVQQWAVYVDSANRMGNEITSIDLLQDGNIIVCDEDGVVTKLNSATGAIMWQVEIDSGPSWDANFRGTATPDGNYIFTNYEDNDYTMYVICISGADGSSVWTKQITRTFGGSNGEIIPEDDFNAQYIDCNDTRVTISATTNLNSVYAGLVFSFPIDGEGIDGTYDEYVISSQSLDVNAQSTTSVAATLNELTSSASINSVSPTNNDSVITATKINIGGAVEIPPPTSIVNGNSYANIAAADGNLVIGVNNDNMTWTFSSTNRAIYGKADENITIAAVDADDDDYGVRQIVVDGVGTIHSRTQLQRDEFRIGLDFQGDNTSWSFDPTTFQVPSYKESSIYSYGGNLNLYAMNDGSNGIARLQSVSNQNGPNVFSQFEATPANANIKVYNGGSNGGTEHVWTFGTDGKLTLPTAVFAGENSILPAIHFPIPETSGGYVGVTNAGIGITANNNTWMFEADGTTTFPNNTINQPSSLLIKSGENTAQVGSTRTITTDSNEGTGAGTPGVVDVAYDNTIIPAYYYPGGGAPNFTDSTITFANGDVRTITSIISMGGYIEITYSGTTTSSSPEFPITLKTGNYAAAIPAPEWTFGTDSNLTIPGSIKSKSISQVGQRITCMDVNGGSLNYHAFNSTTLTGGVYSDIQAGWKVSNGDGWTANVTGVDNPNPGFVTIDDTWDNVNYKLVSFTSPNYQAATSEDLILTSDTSNLTLSANGSLTLPNNGGVIKSTASSTIINGAYKSFTFATGAYGLVSGFGGNGLSVDITPESEQIKVGWKCTFSNTGTIFTVTDIAYIGNSISIAFDGLIDGVVFPMIANSPASSISLQPVNGGNTWAFNADGNLIFPAGGNLNVKSSVPVTSYGVAGDKAGMTAFDGTHFYYCKQNYVDNVTNIWVRVVWTETSW